MAAKAKAPTKSEILKTLAENTELSKKQVAEVLAALSSIIEEQLTKRGGPRVFTIPGLVRLKVVDKKATPAREVRNPRTGEMMMSKPKPARKVVKAYPVKALKDAVL